jgi:hypothetical protein
MKDFYDFEDRCQELKAFGGRPKLKLTHVERQYLDEYSLDRKADSSKYWPKIKGHAVKAHLLRQCAVGKEYLARRYHELDKMAIEQFHHSAGTYLTRLEEQSRGDKPTRIVVGEVPTKDGVQELTTKTYDTLSATSKLVDLLKEVVMDAQRPDEKQLDVNITYID